MTRYFRTALIPVILLVAVASPLFLHAQNYSESQLRSEGYSPTGERCQYNQDGTLRTACGSGALCVPSEPDDLSAPGQCWTKSGLVNLLKAGSLKDLLTDVLKLVVQVGSVLLVLMLVWTGFKFVAAQGREEELRNAKDSLTWVVIGGLLLLGAQALQLVIQATVESL